MVSSPFLLTHLEALMALPNPTARISASALRQLLTAASDAGLGSLFSSDMIRIDGDRVIISLDARQLRALTNWLSIIAESHREQPITATTVPVVNTTTGATDNWMRDVTDQIRTTPVGYSRANIPTTAQESDNQ
ncbi:MAG: hypothetical protein ACO32O_08265 [Ilumatobacteraceae bacterium]